MNPFSIRLAQLRILKNVSARSMSLAIGQNASYISNIECGKALPSMAAFFSICEYLNITPQDFFDEEVANPQKIHALQNDLTKLNDAQLDIIHALVTSMHKGE